MLTFWAINPEFLFFGQFHGQNFLSIWNKKWKPWVSGSKCWHDWVVYEFSYMVMFWAEMNYLRRRLVSLWARRAKGLVSKITIHEAILSWWCKDFGGAGKRAQGGKTGGQAGQGMTRAVWRLSVAGQSSLNCLGNSSQNFQWWSGSWSGMFISGTGLIGQGTGEKRAENSNFSRFTLNNCCFGQCLLWGMDARWNSMHFGDARWSLGEPGWCPGAAGGGCLVVLGPIRNV